MPKYTTRRKQNKFRKTRSNKGGAINDAINAQGRTALYIATRDNNLAKVEELIAAGADVNKTRTDIGATPLYIGSEMSHTNIVEKLIAAGADVNKARTDNGATPLYTACEMGHTNVVEKLIAYGADVKKARTDIGATPLYGASQNGHTKVLEKLIAYGADVNKARTDIGATPLYVASQNGHTNVVEKLIGSGADVNKERTDNGATPLYTACEMGHTNIVEKLIAAGADVNKEITDNGATPLYVASQNGYTNVVEKLIAAGADVNKERTDNGASPLYVASQKGHTKIVEKLISAGADVNTETKTGTTPLYVASQNGHTEVIKVLVSDSRTDINKARNDTGETPLYVAIELLYEEISEILISSPRIDVNKAKLDGTTPLFLASQSALTSMVEKLVAAGADINKSRNTGSSPLYIASSNGYTDIVEILIAAGADINKPRNDGTTPLYMACKKDHISVVKLLLNQPTIDKTRAIQEANSFSEEITKLLISEQEQEEKGELWQGWTRSDVVHMNEIFNKTTATNISLCPICLKTTTRDTGCMHMTHNCKALPGFYHKRLYDLYKSDNKIHWCTICGRIGYGIGSHFEHYKLGLAKDGKPGTHGPTQVFDKSCTTRSGGGGIKEKLMRFQRVREIALKLNKPRYINKISEKEAKEILVEAMWDAPLIANPDIDEMLETSSWNISVNAFLENAKKESDASQAPNVPTPPTHLDPIVHPEETEEFQNSTIVSDKNIIQFRHEGNMHDKEGQQISRDGFAHWLQSVGVNPADEGHLKCWAFHEEGDNKCSVKLYPREVRIALGLAEVPEEGENTEYRKWYELYRKKFNEAEAGMTGGGKRRRKTRKINRRKH